MVIRGIETAVNFLWTVSHHWEGLSFHWGYGILFKKHSIQFMYGNPYTTEYHLTPFRYLVTYAILMHTYIQ